MATEDNNGMTVTSTIFTPGSPLTQRKSEGYRSFVLCMDMCVCREDEWEMHRQNDKRWIYTTIQKKILHGHRPSKAWLSWNCPWRLKIMFKVSILRFHEDITRDSLLRPYFLPPRLTATIYQDPYETSFQSCCNMWICKLRFIYGSCMVVPHQIFSLQF